MKIDRLLAILAVLAENRAVTAPELARRFEVNVRTIRRDVDDLARAGFPVVTRQGAGGGIGLADGYRLNRSVLSAEDLQNIRIGLQSLKSIDPERRIGPLLARLSPDRAMSAEGDPVRIDTVSFYGDALAPKIGLFRRAILEHRRVRFVYHQERGRSVRIVEPDHIAYRWTAWYLHAYCTERADFRLFKLNRLWDPELLDETFEPRPVPCDRLDFDAHFSESHPMTVAIEREAAWRLIEEHGPDSYVELPDGRLLHEGSYVSREYAVRWLLGFGGRAEVLAPPDLREEMAQHAGRMAEIYSVPREANRNG